MLIIFGALWQELKSVAKELQLKKTKKDTLCPVYEDAKGQIRLVITGMGKEAASFGAGWYLGSYGCSGEDIFLNIGSCAGEEDAEGIYRIHGIEDLSDHKTYYPDLRGLSELKTARVYTASSPVGFETIEQIRQKAGGEICLFDMEASGLYQGFRRAVGPDRMIFLKVVTDHGMSETNGKPELSGQVTGEMEGRGAELSEIIKRIIEHGVQREDPLDKEKEGSISPEEFAELEQTLARQLCASATMELQIGQLCRYVASAGMETRFIKAVISMQEAGVLPVSNRRGGKKALETLKNYIVPIY